MKIIMHMDADAFFPSAATILNPRLLGKPICISNSSYRSVVASASYEARKYNIHAGMPLFQAKKFCPGLIILNPNRHLYSEISQKLFKIIASYFPENIEVASIDECFMDASKVVSNFSEARQLAHLIQQEILKITKLSVSFGLSFNKFAAKMSTKLKKPHGISVVKPEDFFQKIGKLPIEKYFGIGNRKIFALKKTGINKIVDLAKSSHENPKLKKIFGKNTSKIINQANGMSTNFILHNHLMLKVISNSKTFFEDDISSRQQILQSFKSLCKNLSYRLWVEELKTLSVGITIRYAGSIDDRKTIQAHIKLTTPTDVLNTIYSHSKKLFNDNWTGEPVRLLGVQLSDLKTKSKTAVQKTLFDPLGIKTSLSFHVIQKVNNHFGKKILTTLTNPANNNLNFTKTRSNSLKT